jgi:hypothetical protein
MDPGSGLVLVAVLVGVSLALWVATGAVIAYVVWAWVYKPWKVMRGDIQAVNAKADAALQAVQQARVLTLTDEEVALRERQMRTRQSARREAQGA